MKTTTRCSRLLPLILLLFLAPLSLYAADSRGADAAAAEKKLGQLPPGKVVTDEQGRMWWADESGKPVYKCEFRVRKGKGGRKTWAFVITGEHNRLVYDSSVDSRAALVPVVLQDGSTGVALIRDGTDGIIATNKPHLSLSHSYAEGLRHFRLLVPLKYIANAEELGVPKRFIRSHPDMLIQIDAFDPKVKFTSAKTASFVRDFQRILAEDPKLYHMFKFKQLAGRMKVKEILKRGVEGFSDMRNYAAARQPVTLVFGRRSDAAYEAVWGETYLVKDPQTGRYVTKNTAGLPHVNIGEQFFEHFTALRTGSLKETLTHELTHFIDQFSLKDGLPYGGRDPMHTSYSVKNKNFAFYEGSAEGVAAAMSNLYNEPYLFDGNRDVSLNHASFEELMRVPGMKEEVAREIIALRKRGVRFHEFEQLAALRSIDADTFRKLRWRAYKSTVHRQGGDTSKIVVNGKTVSLNEVDPHEFGRLLGLDEKQVEEFAALQKRMNAAGRKLHAEMIVGRVRSWSRDLQLKLQKHLAGRVPQWRVAEDKRDIVEMRHMRDDTGKRYLRSNELLRNEGAFSDILNKLLTHPKIRNSYEKPTFYEPVKDLYPALRGKDLSKLTVDDIKKAIPPEDNAVIKMQHVKIKYDTTTVKDFLNRYFQEYPSQKELVARIVGEETNYGLVSEEAAARVEARKRLEHAYLEATRDKSPAGRKRAAELLAMLREKKAADAAWKEKQLARILRENKLVFTEDRTPVRLYLKDGRVVDLNKASVEELAKVPGIDAETAEAIVRNRANQEAGEFLHIRDAFELYWPAIKDENAVRRIPRDKAELLWRLSNPPIEIALPGGRKVKLDTLTADELASIKGIGKERARRIIAYREKVPGGRIVDLGELGRVSGIGEKTLERLGFRKPTEGWNYGLPDDVHYLEFKKGRRSGVAEAVPAAPAGSLGRAKASLQYDFARGGIFRDVAITLGMSIYNRISSGGTFHEGLQDAMAYVTSPVFYIGDLMGGVLGAALGAAVPIPGALAARGLLGAMAASVPTVAGAMIMSQLGAVAVQLIMEGRFSMGALLGSIDWVMTGGQIIGSVIGATLASALFPGATLAAILGGIAGGVLGTKLVSWLTGGDPASMSPFDRRSAYGGGRWAQHPWRGPAPMEPGASAAGPAAPAASVDSIDALKAAVDAAYKEFVAADGVQARKEALKRYLEVRKAYDAALKRIGSAAAGGR